jgi:hypothetical protein
VKKEKKKKRSPGGTFADDEEEEDEEVMQIDQARIAPRGARHAHQSAMPFLLLFMPAMAVPGEAVGQGN